MRAISVSDSLPLQVVFGVVLCAFIGIVVGALVNLVLALLFPGAFSSLLPVIAGSIGAGVSAGSYLKSVDLTGHSRNS